MVKELSIASSETNARMQRGVARDEILVLGARALIVCIGRSLCAKTRAIDRSFQSSLMFRAFGATRRAPNPENRAERVCSQAKAEFLHVSGGRQAVHPGSKATRSNYRGQRTGRHSASDRLAAQAPACSTYKPVVRSKLIAALLQSGPTTGIVLGSGTNSGRLAFIPAFTKMRC